MDPDPLLADKHFSILLLHDKRRRFLLQLRSKNEDFLPHYWCFVGGELKPGETPYKALKRKAFAEINYEVKNPKYVLTSVFEHPDFRAHLHIFTEEYNPEIHQLLLKEGENCAWFDADHLDTIKILSHDKDLIRYVDAWLESQKTRDVAIIVLYDKQKRILLQQREETRSFLPGYWSFFGGGMDPGENSLDAVLRESKEELAYIPDKPQLILKTSFQHTCLMTNIHIYIAYCPNKRKLKLLEGQDWGWFHREEIDKLKILESDRYIMSYIFEYLDKSK